ncbi:MAG: hypothetical protein WCO66_05335, partial [Candidatus Absconditabacteria bacterium]
FIVGGIIHAFVNNKRWFHNLLDFLGLVSCIIMLLLVCEYHNNPALLRICIGTWVVSLIIYLFGTLERKPYQSGLLSNNKALPREIRRDLRSRGK